MGQPWRARVDAVVVGGGFGGMYMLYKLPGFPCRASRLAMASAAPGTGTPARCTYTWSEGLQKEWRWTEKYAAQAEILAYANHVADRFDLRPMIAFETRVLAAHFDEAADRWRVTTDQGDELMASSWSWCLSTPRKPPIPGVDDFAGPTYHTGAWPHEGVDHRPAVIGSMRPAQSIPQIAKQAAQVTVFQRTAHYSAPANNTPLTDKDIEDFWKMYPESP